MEDGGGGGGVDGGGHAPVDGEGHGVFDDHDNMVHFTFSASEARARFSDASRAKFSQGNPESDEESDIPTEYVYSYHSTGTHHCIYYIYINNYIRFTTN